MERGTRAFPGIGDGDSKESCTSQTAEIAKGIGWQDLRTDAVLERFPLGSELFSLHTHGCTSCIPYPTCFIPPPAHTQAAMGVSWISWDLLVLHP